MDSNKIEEQLAPTAEMQLGESDVKQLVKDTDLGGRSTTGFAGKVMLGVSLLITIAVQMVSAALGLRGTNLLWGVKTLVGSLDPKLKDHAKAVAKKVLQDPLVSDSVFSRFENGALGQLTGRWRLASSTPSPAGAPSGSTAPTPRTRRPSRRSSARSDRRFFDSPSTRNRTM